LNSHPSARTISLLCLLVFALLNRTSTTVENKATRYDAGGLAAIEYAPVGTSGKEKWPSASVTIFAITSWSPMFLTSTVALANGLSISLFKRALTTLPVNDLAVRCSKTQMSALFSWAMIGVAQRIRIKILKSSISQNSATSGPILKHQSPISTHSEH
jgi:hypothetical protein